MPGIVFITGCTRGLGRAMALGFAQRGWTITGCATRPEATAALQAELGQEHLILPCDVTDSIAVNALAARVLAERGAPDLLINNAAIINADAPLWEVTAEEFSRVVDVNLKGVHHLCRAFIPAMIRRGSGVIVNFSSGWGRSTSPNVAPYCATKWGIEGLTKGLAEDLPAGLAAVPLNPGIIDTDMLRSSFGAEAGDYPDPTAWAGQAVPFLEKLGPKDNGKSLTVPGH